MFGIEVSHACHCVKVWTGKKVINCFSVVFIHESYLTNITLFTDSSCFFLESEYILNHQLDELTRIFIKQQKLDTQRLIKYNFIKKQKASVISLKESSHN